MIEILKSFGTGLIVGVLFTLLKLPLPAPAVLAGVVGIAGIFVGFVLAKNFIK